MTDRELLEAAAKAAGMTLEWGEVFKIGEDEVDCSDMAYATDVCPNFGPVQWNPLEDEGDALRLAVRLCINLEFGCVQQHVYAVRRDLAVYQDTGSGGSLELATCRAIVLAAAEIGKAVP